MTYVEKIKREISSCFIDKEDYYQKRMTKKQVDELMAKREETRARNKFVEGLIKARKRKIEEEERYGR